MTLNSPSSLKTRILSALVLIPLAVGAAWAGGVVFAALCALAGILIGWEWSRLFYPSKDKRSFLSLWIGGGAIIVAVLASTRPLFLLPLSGVLFFVPLIWIFVKESRVMPAFGGIYAAFPVAALILFRNDMEYGIWAIVWLFGIVWATDIAAYFTGKSLGGPKLSPRWSPNKTWSGLLGGVAAASLVSAFVAYALGNTSGLILAALGGAMAIVAQMGDIFESSLKRQAGVKDSSRIIPGHGGVMDRLDGLITASSLALVIGLIRGGTHAAKGLLIW